MSNLPISKIKLAGDSIVQDLNNFRWILIQRCLAALEDCIKRFPQHYKSYYRLAHFYFHSPTHKDYNKFKELMFGERGLFVGQRPNNFFYGIWRIPVSEVDRPGSFAYHMSRCIHLLLDFLKETGDHKTLLDMAIQLKYTPDLVKKYLRDNEREGISKEALFLSVQILRRLKSEYAKENNRSKNELLLIQVYKSYKRVFKCWQQKDNTLSNLLLSVYQNIVGSKEDVSNDVIIKYCQKLQSKEKEIEYQSSISNNQSEFPAPEVTTNTAIAKPTINKPDVPQSVAPPQQSSSSLTTLFENPNPQLFSRPATTTPTHSLPLNPLELSSQIMSMLGPYTQSPLMFPLPLQETCTYAYALQQKLQATKQKLKRTNNKPKTESKPSSAAGSSGGRAVAAVDGSGANHRPPSKCHGRPKKNNRAGGGNNNGNGHRTDNESKIARVQQKPASAAKVRKPKNSADKSSLSGVSCVKFNPALENVNRFQPPLLPPPTNNVPMLGVNSMYDASASAGSSAPKIPSRPPPPPSMSVQTKVTSGRPKTTTVRDALMAAGKAKHIAATKTTNDGGSRKSVYIDLDSAAEQARLKRHKVPEKKHPVSVAPLLNPALLLSSCPGLSITPVVQNASAAANSDAANAKRFKIGANEPQTPSRLQASEMPKNNFHFEQLQHLGNSLTITKTEKNGNKNKPELILLD